MVLIMPPIRLHLVGALPLRNAIFYRDEVSLHLLIRENDKDRVILDRLPLVCLPDVQERFV
jgi:hypothetical protein